MPFLKHHPSKKDDQVTYMVFDTGMVGDRSFHHSFSRTD